jgi:hypothetical protein
MVVAVGDTAQQVLDEDYEEVLERLRVADFLYTEYSLEEVIYQLAKVIFSQSLNRGQHRIRDTYIASAVLSTDHELIPAGCKRP